MFLAARSPWRPLRHPDLRHPHHHHELGGRLAPAPLVVELGRIPTDTARVLSNARSSFRLRDVLERGQLVLSVAFKVYL